jgi:hypothetical protein
MRSHRCRWLCHLDTTLCSHHWLCDESPRTKGPIVESTTRSRDVNGWVAAVFAARYTLHLLFPLVGSVDSLFAHPNPTNSKLFMGIQGLLPFLKSIQNQRHLSELSGQTLAVDGYCWLHRGTYTCSTELATGRNTSK